MSVFYILMKWSAYSADKGYKPPKYYEIYQHNQVYFKQNSNFSLKGSTTPSHISNSVLNLCSIELLLFFLFVWKKKSGIMHFLAINESIRLKEEERDWWGAYFSFSTREAEEDEQERERGGPKCPPVILAALRSFERRQQKKTTNWSKMSS